MHRSDRQGWRREFVALVVWAGMFVLAVTYGKRLQSHGKARQLGAVPLYGEWHLRFSWWSLPAALFGLAVLVASPVAIRRMRWGLVLLTAACATAAWAVVLALVEGPRGITDPLLGQAQYLPFLPRVRHVGRFLHTFVRRLPTYPVHVRGHPPGMLVVLSGLQRTGLSGAGWAAALMIASYGGGVAALLITVRSLAGEEAARLAAPFIAFAPAAITVATTADALFAGVAMTGLALFTVSTDRDSRTSDLLGLAAGVTLGAGLFLSYGLVVVGVPVVGIALVRRRARPLLMTAIGVAAVMAAFWCAGFWWFDGLRATNQQYRLSVARTRPYGYFLFADLAVFGLIVGPATIASLARLDIGSSRWRRRSFVPILGLAMVILADGSGYSKAEVERIWLFLVPPVAAATACLTSAGSDRLRRGWLSVQLLAGFGLELALRTPW